MDLQKQNNSILIKELTRKIFNSKIRLLTNHPFFGAMLSNIKFKLSNQIKEKEGLGTNGKTILINPISLEKYSELEIDFLLMHQIMHIVLKHVERRNNYKRDLFKEAADLVVNSNILYAMNLLDTPFYIQGKLIEHLTPKGDEAYLYSTEEVMRMLEDSDVESDNTAENILEGTIELDTPTYLDNNNKTIKNKSFKKDNIDLNTVTKEDSSNANDKTIDSHERWGELDSDEENLDEKINDELLKAHSFASCQKGIGKIPDSIEIMVTELTKGTIDWRTYLNNFIQENVVDYSFMPPDRRFQESDFCLPDFNEKDEIIENVVFMVDVSGSMSNVEIRSCFNEIQGALEQFKGKLRGYVGFFDADVKGVYPIDNTSLNEFKLHGGGGTDVNCVFNYIKDNMLENLPKTLIILTDGCTPYPSESAALDIPVLWLINNEHNNPPFGNIVRFKI